MTCPPSCETLIALVAENGSMSEKDKNMLKRGACQKCKVPVSMNPEDITLDEIPLLYSDARRQDMLLDNIATHLQRIGSAAS